MNDDLKRLSATSNLQEFSRKLEQNDDKLIGSLMKIQDQIEKKKILCQFITQTQNNLLNFDSNEVSFRNILFTLRPGKAMPSPLLLNLYEGIFPFCLSIDNQCFCICCSLIFYVYTLFLQNL